MMLVHDACIHFLFCLVSCVLSWHGSMHLLSRLFSLACHLLLELPCSGAELVLSKVSLSGSRFGCRLIPLLRCSLGIWVSKSVPVCGVCFPAFLTNAHFDGRLDRFLGKVLFAPSSLMAFMGFMLSVFPPCMVHLLLWCCLLSCIVLMVFFLFCIRRGGLSCLACFCVCVVMQPTMELGVFVTRTPLVLRLISKN